MLWRRRKQREEDLERELRSHMESEASEQQERGLSTEEALYAAQRAFGSVTLTKATVTLFENVFSKVKVTYEQLPPCFDVRRAEVSTEPLSFA